MTTDDFTDAARAEARSFWLHEYRELPTYRVDDIGKHMAAWARTHLAAQEPTDAKVEAAVEEYKNRQVQIHFDPVPHQVVHVRARCPRCGHR